MKSEIKELARERWFGILTGLGGIGAEFLTDKHGPCPLCGGTDRWRWDDRNGEGGGFCSQCGGPQSAGGSISGMDLLMRSRGWDFKEAARELERFLGNDTQLPIKTVKSTKRPARTPEIPPVGTPPPALGRATAQWCYGSLDGEPWYFVQRIEDAAKLDKRGKPSKTIVRRFWLDGRWHFPSRKDPFSIEWAAPRPLLGWEQLAARAGDPVLVVEGESTWDAAAMLFPGYVVLTWPNGGKSVQLSDWAPLAGREVVIWPDADPDGAACAKKLSGILRGVGAGAVSVVKPPEDAPLGWDLADAGEWTEEDAFTYLKGNCGEEFEEAVEPPGPAAPATERGDGDSRPYTLLGFSGDDYFYQPKGSGQVTRLTRAGHNSTNLFGIAPIEYWKDTYPRYNKDGEVIGIDWLQCYSDLISSQHAVGCYDPSRIRGVGAWWDDGRTVFHLGDRLIVDGVTHPVSMPHKSEFIYQRLPRRAGPGAAEPLSDQEGANLLAIAEQFHWEHSASGMLLAGWIALGPICGSLEWRPHIWVNAVAGSGKSTIFNDFLRPLLSDVVLKVKGATTEAGIRQRLKCDALPVMFDEAESNEKRDMDRMQGVLALARVASSEDEADMLKGSVSSEAVLFNVRSMFVLSSINTALKQGPDKSRFSLLMLRTPDSLTAQQKADHWQKLKAELVQHVTKETGKRLMARMINLIPVVREAAATFSRLAAIEYNSARIGEQIGTLLAGAWAMTSQQAPSDQEALAVIRACGWSPDDSRSDDGAGDQGDCLQTIIQTRLRVEVESRSQYSGRVEVIAVSRTVSELIEILAGGGKVAEVVTPEAAETELGRQGLRVEDGFLVVSNTAKGIRAMLRETQWAAGGWPNLLVSHKGARRRGVTRFKGLASATRAVEIPLSLLPQEVSAKM